MVSIPSFTAIISWSAWTVSGVPHRPRAKRRYSARPCHAGSALPDFRWNGPSTGSRPFHLRRSVEPACFAELGLKPDALLGVGVDRLDYTKGVEERFLAVERLLEQHPEFRGRFTFVQLAAPSRTLIERYRQLNESVEQVTARINTRFGQGSYRPIVLLRAHHEPPTVFRYYRAADVCYVSSLHDGMNLVAKEFVAAREDERGVLVLSQFTGAARELTEALIVNPYDTDEASAALATSLSMSPEEQRERMRSMRAFLAEFNVYRWAGRMLVDAARLRRRGTIDRPPGGTLAGGKSGLMRYILSVRSRSVLKRFATGNVLLAFDFDGTLAPITSEPDRATLRPGTRKLLRSLTSLYSCIIVSGRSRADVRKRLRGIKFDEIIGNHGIEPWSSSRAIARAVETWIPALKLKLGRFHGVVLENKRFSVSIHYRKERHKRGVLKAVTSLARRLPGAKLVGGKQVVNIVLRGAADKGLAVERARQKLGCDKVIYVGDDDTDEDVFALARNRRFLTTRVGAKRSSLARFYVRDQREIDPLLRTLIELRLRELIHELPTAPKASEFCKLSWWQPLAGSPQKLSPTRVQYAPNTMQKP